MAHLKIKLTGNWLLNESWLFRFLRKTLTPYLAFVIDDISNSVFALKLLCLKICFVYSTILMK